MKTLLVPTDFSQEAANALQVAASIARKTGAQIKLLHVVDVVTEPTFSTIGQYYPEDPMEQIYKLKLIEHAYQTLEEIRDEHLSDIPVSLLVKGGSVYSTLADFVDAEKVDLVVMGTKGSSGLKGILVGSNTEKMVRNANCLVLTVQGEVTDFDIHTILLPTDFETVSYQFFEKLSLLNNFYNFTTHLLYVNTPTNFDITFRLEAKANKFLQKLPLKNVICTIIDDYTTVDGIGSFARKNNVDLIAMLTHQRKGLTYFLEGSITEDVIHHNSIPILTFGLDNE